MKPKTKKVKAWAIVNWIDGLETIGLTKVSMQGWLARNKPPAEADQIYRNQYRLTPVLITYQLPLKKTPRP